MVINESIIQRGTDHIALILMFQFHVLGENLCYCKLWLFDPNLIHSLKYQRFKTSGSKERGSYNKIFKLTLNFIFLGLPVISHQWTGKTCFPNDVKFLLHTKPTQTGLRNQIKHQLLIFSRITKKTIKGVFWRFSGFLIKLIN